MGTLRVRNIAQKVLFEEELSGQISDGQWENSSPREHWKPWCDATVVVDPNNVGRDFYARRESYNFTARDLLAVVQDRMLEYVRVATGNPGYSESDLKADLSDLKTIIKIMVPSHTPIPEQPREYTAKLAVDGYPREWRVYVETPDDPQAVMFIQQREMEQAGYRLKRVEERILEKQKELAKLEDERTELLEKTGMLV